MITVDEATRIILNETRSWGRTKAWLAESVGRVLAENLVSDRDFPPFDRVMYDGIAIRYDDYAAGQRQFPVVGMQAAGSPPQVVETEGNCIEIMTGAMLPPGFDTIVQYEWLDIRDGVATIHPDKKVTRGRHVHHQGMDRRQGGVIVKPPRIITAAEINIAATIGKSELEVFEVPEAAIISTGDELVDIDETPMAHQIRRSNVFAVATLIGSFHIGADIMHADDKEEEIRETLAEALDEYDLIILSGGVSKGKYDHIPKVLDALGVQKHFHRVAQRPGKPFWFGTKGDKVVFALPGNPVSTYVSTLRYVLPWLRKSLHLEPMTRLRARLKSDFTFEPPLRYFLAVELEVDDTGCLWAIPRQGQGSGDLANLALIDGFLELPEDRDFFPAGSAYPLWKFRP